MDARALARMQTGSAAHSRPVCGGRKLSLCVHAKATLDRPTQQSGLDAAAAPPSGLQHLPEAARARATDRKANKFEKVKYFVSYFNFYIVVKVSNKLRAC